MSADAVILSAATLPEENEELATILKVPRNPEGFFIEAHVKLRPVDFASEGIYLCGTAHGPKLMSESIAQAMAAAARAASFLSVKGRDCWRRCRPGRAESLRGLSGMRAKLPIRRSAHQRK